MESDKEEIFGILSNLGLDEEEIKSVNKRNKMINETTASEIDDIVNFFKIKCNVDKDDIARIIIKNPFILNESFDRIDLLSEIYEKIGFTPEEYKTYISNYAKAFSLNPKEVLDTIYNMIKEGESMENVKRLMIENADRLF